MSFPNSLLSLSRLSSSRRSSFSSLSCPFSSSFLPSALSCRPFFSPARPSPSLSFPTSYRHYLAPTHRLVALPPPPRLALPPPCRFLLLLLLVAPAPSLCVTPTPPYLASRRRRRLTSSPLPPQLDPPPHCLTLLFVNFPSVAVVVVVGMVVEVVVEAEVALSSLRWWMCRLCRRWVGRLPALGGGDCGGGDCRGYGVRKLQWG